MRVLVWNLYHGRAVPPAGRPLLQAFADTIAAWPWDVALLQEVPPWWPPALALASGARQRSARTSRNQLLALRRAIASRAPDLLKANGGGCNAILVRGRPVLEHRQVELTRRPERRVAHGVRLADAGWVVNLHATLRPKPRTRADVARAAAAWAQADRLVLGGDFNLRDPGAPGLARLAGHRIDHVLGRGWHADGPATVLDAGPLSDHRPLLVTLSAGAARSRAA
jgi:endonuclease/exonuclease/phosphatase family metal-dependent hydrolase